MKTKKKIFYIQNGNYYTKFNKNLLITKIINNQKNKKLETD